VVEAVLFVASGCPWCARARRYLKERGVPFREVDLARDPPAARTVVLNTGQTGVPVLQIGWQWIVGFDLPRIDRALEAMGYGASGGSRNPVRPSGPPIRQQNG